MNNIKWVKQLVSFKEYEDYYRYNNTYTFLCQEENGIWLGFCIVGEIPLKCKLATYEDLALIDQHRRARNIRPFPIKIPEEEPVNKISQKTIKGLELLKDFMIRKGIIGKYHLNAND